MTTDRRQPSIIAIFASVMVCVGTIAEVVCCVNGQSRAAGATKAASSPTKATQAAIDALCNNLVPITKKSSGRLFGLAPGAAWREYNDSKELEKAIGRSEIPQKARFWRGKDGAAAVQIAENPASGDWSQAVDYCFRSDGSLARTESTLITFDTADEIDDATERFRVRYFDPEGKEVAHREEVKNAKSRQSAKRTFADQTETIYRRIGDMPFGALLIR